jgi:hypothetical protein
MRGALLRGNFVTMNPDSISTLTAGIDRRAFLKLPGGTLTAAMVPGAVRAATAQNPHRVKLPPILEEPN